MLCYNLLKRMKVAYPEVRERIKSICFSDDSEYAPLQAADLFAWVSRREAAYRFIGQEYEYRKLFEAFQTVHGPEHYHRHLHFAGGFYTAEELTDFATKLKSQ